MFVCLFDIDGTLLASGGAGKAALETSLQEEFQIPLRADIPYSGRTDRAIARDLLHQHGIEPTDENWQRLLQGYLRRLPDSLRRFNGRVLPGILGLLDHLAQRRDVAIGLLTGNVHAGAKVKLGHFGLMERFAFGGFGDRHFHRNDVAKDALDAVRSHVSSDFDPSRIWVIGDTPLDVECARSIGAKVAAVATGQHTTEMLVLCQPDILFSDLSDPSPLLRELA